MNADTLPVLITGRATIAFVIILALVLGGLAIAGAVKNGAGKRFDPLGLLLGSAMIFAIPLAIAAFVGFMASALLIGVGAPAPTYIFTLFLALMTFRAAVRHPSYGMEGCTKMFGLVWSGYAIFWSLVSFDATGGLAAIEAGAVSPRWLQPPLAALPFAVLIMKLSDKKKRTVWLFLGAMAFLSAALALSFFPVENGFARNVLPESDWLRFPLAGLAIAALLAGFRLIIHLRLKPNIRRARRRDLKSGLLFLAFIMVAFGLAWAAARSLIAALA